MLMSLLRLTMVADFYHEADKCCFCCEAKDQESPQREHIAIITVFICAITFVTD